MNAPRPEAREPIGPRQPHRARLRVELLRLAALALLFVLVVVLTTCTAGVRPPGG